MQNYRILYIGYKYKTRADDLNDLTVAKVYT